MITDAVRAFAPKVRGIALQHKRAHLMLLAS
jgi:hypothetical protein